MKKLLPLLLLLSLLLPGCSPTPQPRQVTWLDLFDTVTTLTGYAATPEEFDQTAQALHGQLLHYHQLLDIYHNYPGVNNLKTVNDQAGVSPVAVEAPLLALLADCKGYYEATGGKVNIALGSVLTLWHEAREAASPAPPEETAIAQALTHCSMENLILDIAAGTAYLTDPKASLDVGAVGKGWAAEQVRELLPEGYLLSIGGNVVANSGKPGGKPWVIGVQSPTGGGYLTTVPLEHGSVVTSGDYQRYFDWNGVRYHHIVDPATGYPGGSWTSVTVSCENSALADCLSTALFLMSRSEGQKLLDFFGAKAIWVDVEGNIFYSD